MTEVSSEVEETKPEKPEEESVAVLLQRLGGPDSTQIDAWKAQYGEVFVSAFSREEIYVWRALRRHEYRAMQLDLSNPEKKMDNFDYEEAICIATTLWPKLSAGFFASAKGGTPTSLAEQVMQNSNFFSPQQAAAFVMKL